MDRGREGGRVEESERCAGSERGLTCHLICDGAAIFA